MEFFKNLEIKTNKEIHLFENTENVKCLIIGSGPAGYTASVYAARANMKPVLYTGIEIGGQLIKTHRIENFPGFPDGITGIELMENLKKQTERFGTEVRFGVVTSVDFSQKPLKVTIEGGKDILCDTVIIATGAVAEYLGIEAEKKYAGRGVSACATCDGFFYKGKDVAVVGGGDTAMEDALYLSGLCRKVYLIVRRNVLRASKIMQERIFNTPNVEILWEHQPVDLFGEEGVEGVVLVKKKGTPEEEIIKLKIDGFFLAIGHIPNSDLFSKFIETDSVGYIKTIPGTSKTNIPGVFAAGDVQDPYYKQAVTAAGSGCIAAIDAERYLTELKS